MNQYYAEAVRDDGSDAGWGRHINAKDDDDASSYAYQLMIDEAGSFGAARIELYRMEKIDTVHIWDTHL